MDMHVQVNAADDGLDILKTLGRGGEGIVYLARDQTTNKKTIVKYFYQSIVDNPSRSLRHYANTIMDNPVGLPRITLIERDNQIVGVKYGYTRLHRLHARIFMYANNAAQAMFGNFCRMQHHLISRCGLAISDPVLFNFMMAEDGMFHFIDFGYGIQLLDRPHLRNYGILGYGFVMLLCDIYRRNIKKDILPSEGYSFESPCRYCFYEGLDAIAEEHRWVKEILSEVRSRNAGIFHDAEFYKNLAERLPQKVRFPNSLAFISRALFIATNRKDQIN